MRRVKHGLRIFVLASAACAALHLGAAAPASAGTLDQQQTSTDANLGLFTNSSPAQTFTAGITGALDQVDLSLIRIGATLPPSFTVEIRNTSAGQPGTAVLATSTLPTSSVGGSLEFVPIAFATPAPVTAGTQYAIVAYSPGAPADDVAWGVNTAGNLYSGGNAWTSAQPHPPTAPWDDLGPEDMAFKTYVTPPSPPAGSTGQQAAALKKCKKKKSKKVRKKCKKKAKKLPV
jgi:hypothetical protein